MYKNCGFLGFFKNHATEEDIKHSAHKLGICGTGTYWSEKNQTCVGLNENHDQFEITQRSGMCECDKKPTYARTQIECESSAENCKWKTWNPSTEMIFDIDR